MPKIAIEIANGFYQSASLPLNAQQCINWVPVVPELPGLSTRALFDPPGISSFGDTNSGKNYGCQEMGGIPYVVSGGSLYSLDGGGNPTLIGNIGATRPVSMANNGTKLAIVIPGVTLWAYDSVTGSLTQVTDASYRVSDTVCYVDGYYIYTASDGSVFFSSNINDPLTFNALSFSALEIDPSPIVAGHVNHNQLFILAGRSVGIFQNIGGIGFPFQLIQGANIQKGCFAKFSLVEFDNTFLFVGGGLNEKAAIWRVVGSSQAEKVSSAAIDYQIQQFTQEEISSAFAWTYSWQGNFFAGFTFESTRIPSVTFVYDATSSALSGKAEWHQRQTGAAPNRWRVNGIMRCYGKTLVTDWTDGRVGYFDSDTYTDYGDYRFRTNASAPFYQDEIPMFQGQMELTMESGVGLTNGGDPQIDFDYSDDGGRTWSFPRARSYGATGQYQSLCIWRANGRIPRHRVFRFSTGEPVKSNLLKLMGYTGVGSQ